MNKGTEDQVQKETMNQGSSFGNGKESKDCLVESIHRSDLCLDISCELKVKYFLRGCLSSVPLANNFCEIPERIDLLESVSWSMDYCRRLNAKKVEPCSRVLGVIQSICGK